MPIAGSMPIAGGLIDIEHVSNAVIVAAAAAAPGLAQTWEQPPGPVGAGLTWLVHAALIVGQADGFALTDAADSADVADAHEMSGLVGVVVVGSWLSLIVAIGVLCYRLLRQPRQGRRSARPTGVGLLALGAVVGGAAVAAGAVIAVVAAVDELTDVVLRWPGPRPAGELDELLHRRAAIAAGGGGVTGWGYGAAAVLYLVEMIVRQATIFAALAAAPLIATNLRGWRRSPRRMTAVRWALTAIVIKPALTLALIVGIEVRPAGGLLALVTVAAVLVLLISGPVTDVPAAGVPRPGHIHRSAGGRSAANL